MASDPELAKYLHALGATDKEDIVSEERARRQQARQSRVAADIEAMDTDEQKVCIIIDLKVIHFFLKRHIYIYIYYYIFFLV